MAISTVNQAGLNAPLTLTAPVISTITNGAATITLPATTGTLALASTVPAFLAYQASVQSVSNATVTTINFDSETFDTNSNFNTSNGRFTPTVAGYYQINLSISLQTVSSIMIMLYKTGSHYLTCVGTGIAGASNSTGTLACVVYMNGSTDYLQGNVYQSTGVSLNSNNDSRFMQFSGSLIRAA
jgi:hypothetical protein